MNKTLLLTRLQLINVFGINEIKYGHDPKKARKKIGELILYIILAGFAALFFWGACMAFTELGQQKLIPLFLCVAGSALVLFIDIFYAGAVIFNPKTYEREIVFPVRPSAIIVSRLAGLYLVNLIFMLIVYLPGCIAANTPEMWGLGIVGIFLTPLIPMAVSLALGAVGSAVGSHVKHKSAVKTAVSIIFTLALFLVIFSHNSAENTLVGDVAGIFTGLSAQIAAWYPPAGWFASGSIVFVALFAAVSLAAAALFVWIASMKFASICSAMNTHYAKKNYHMTNQSSSSQLKSLYKLELKRYFASSVYVTNTIMGYILAVVLAVVLCILGPETIANFTGGENLFRFGAFMLALFGIMSPVSASSISIEGKQWWMKLMLPVPAKKIIQAKLLVNFTISLPIMLAASVIYCFSAAESVIDVLAFIAIPLICTVYSGVLGMFENLKHPKFDWDNEIKAVKQGPALTHTMLFGILPLAVLFVVSVFTGVAVAALLAFVVLGILSVVLYRKSLGFELNSLENA